MRREEQKEGRSERGRDKGRDEVREGQGRDVDGGNEGETWEGTLREEMAKGGPWGSEGLSDEGRFDCRKSTSDKCDFRAS